MFDIVILNGSILDGSGREARSLDVGVRDGKIAALGNLKDAAAKETIEAAGKTVCPGFLDLHRHADAALFRPGYGDCDLYQAHRVHRHDPPGLLRAQDSQDPGRHHP